MGVSGYVQVCAGVSRCAWVWAGMGRGFRVWAGVSGCGYARVCACVWDKFSEFLLENRVPTSADFNTYPIRIFYLSQKFLMSQNRPWRVSTKYALAPRYYM